VNADLSVAPEIAQLAVPSVLPLRPRPATAPRTAGRAAGELTRLAATPQLWWDLVRFDPAGPVRIPVPGTPGAWLLVLPPGATVSCDCEYATLLAGEAAESAPLHAGRVRVHGSPGPHQVRGSGQGYSVSMHSFYPERGVAPLTAPGIPPGE
jgi:hypothetical protein